MQNYGFMQKNPLLEIVQISFLVPNKTLLCQKLELAVLKVWFCQIQLNKWIDFDWSIVQILGSISCQMLLDK